MKEAGEGIAVTFEGEGLGDRPKEQTFDRVLVSIGRRPNGAVPGSRSHAGQGQPAGLHRGQREAADGRAVDLRDRRRGRRADAGAQGLARGARGGRGDCRREGGVRAAGHPRRGLHRSGAGVVRPDRERCPEGGPQGHRRAVPVGGLGPRADARSSRRHDQAGHRSRHRAHPRRRHRRTRRRRVDCGRRAGRGDGRERDRPEDVDPSAPDAVRNADGVGRGVLRPRHARLSAEAG